MKSTLVLSLLLLVVFSINNIVLASSSITQFLMLDEDNGKLFIYNATTGDQLSATSTFTKSQYYVFDGILGAFDDFIYFVGIESAEQTNLLQYSISDNKYKQIGQVNALRTMTIVMQQFAFDPVANIAAVVGIPMSTLSSNLTLDIYDFNKQTISQVSIDIWVDLNEGFLPVGAYDVDTGDYYIMYADKTGVEIAIYNLISETVVSINNYTGPRILYPKILVYQGQIVIVDINFYKGFKLYTLSGDSYTLFHSIPCNYPTSISVTPVALKDNIAILVTTVKKNEYTFTTLDLSTMNITTSPVSTLHLPDTGDYVTAL